MRKLKKALEAQAPDRQEAFERDVLGIDPEPSKDARGSAKSGATGGTGPKRPTAATKTQIHYFRTIRGFEGEKPNG